MPNMSRPHHHVYVVELSKDVLRVAKFRKCNPGYVNGKPCVYVGMTGFNPMAYKDAVEREIEIGIDPRSAGFGVWQA